MAAKAGWTDRFTFGGRMPWAVGLLLAFTVVTSLVVAFTERHGGEHSAFQLTALVAERVLRGEVWRLLTWALVETHPLSLFAACLLLWWFGRDLADDWGSHRFLAVYAGVAVFASVGTCGLALVDRDVMPRLFIGGWSMACAVIVAWGLWFPDKPVRIFWLLTFSGYWLAWLVVALTGAYAIYFGWESVMPMLLAEGAMLGWLFRRSFTARWRAAARARAARARESRARDLAARRRSSEIALRTLEAAEADEDLPPLPKELEGLLGVSPKNEKDPKP